MLVLRNLRDVLTNGDGSAKALTAFVGLDPKPHRSGTSVNKIARISRQGNKKFLSRLYMGALGGVRGNNALKLFYQRLVAKGKAKKIALVASSRKIVVWALAAFRSNQKWDNSRHIPTA